MVKELDVIALKTDLPRHGLKRGDIGAVVLLHKDKEMEVEFVNFGGATVALVHLRPAQVRAVGSSELPQARLTRTRLAARKAGSPGRRNHGRKLQAG